MRAQLLLLIPTSLAMIPLLPACAGSGGARIEPINTGLTSMASNDSPPSIAQHEIPNPVDTVPTDPWEAAAINLQELLAREPATGESPPIEHADISRTNPETGTKSRPTDPTTDPTASTGLSRIEDGAPGMDALLAEQARRLALAVSTPDDKPSPRALTTTSLSIEPSIEPSIEQVANSLQAMLLRRAASGDPSDTTTAALFAGALGLSDAQLDALDRHPSERARVDAARTVAASLTRAGATTDEILEAIDQLTRDLENETSSFRVTDARLCSEVRAFGDYDPINDATLLAGITNRLIVYSEPDRFANRETTRDGEPLYEVDLSQEITLYHDAPGELQVWHHPRARITESSRRQRRDFYLVDQIELPASLSVGSYLLKISTRDEVSGTTAERTIPIRVVADPTLARVPG